MAEKIDLTTPYQPNPASANDLSVAKLILDWEGQGIHITLTKGSVRAEFSYNGATAVTLMTALNKANLTVKSLHKRVLEQLIADGKLAGTISGTPD